MFTSISSGMYRQPSLFHYFGPFLVLICIHIIMTGEPMHTTFEERMVPGSPGLLFSSENTPQLLIIEK